MKVKPMIGEYGVPGIQRIGTVEERYLMEIPVPGLEGSYHQDLGSAPISIKIEGTLAGDEARDNFLNEVREKFKTVEPIDFVADITSATEINKVLISDLKIEEVAGSADTFRYSIILTQYVEPPFTAPGAELGFGDLTELAQIAGGLVIRLSALRAAITSGNLSGTGPAVAAINSLLDQHETVQTALQTEVLGRLDDLSKRLADLPNDLAERIERVITVLQPGSTLSHGSVPIKWLDR